MRPNLAVFLRTPDEIQKILEAPNCSAGHLITWGLSEYAAVTDMGFCAGCAGVPGSASLEEWHCPACAGTARRFAFCSQCRKPHATQKTEINQAPACIKKAGVMDNATVAG